MKTLTARTTLLALWFLIETSCLAQDTNWNFQLMVASRREDAAAIIKCLNAGAQMRSDEGEEAFARAISRFNMPRGPEVLALMLKKGADVNGQLDDGYTPLQLALLNDHGEILPLFLLENGAKPNGPEPSGLTPIFQAAQRAYGEVIQALLQRGVKLESTNAQGQTPLMFLARRWEYPQEGWPACQEEEVVKLARQLIQQGADPSRIDALGKTAADYALEGNNYELLTFLDKAKRHEALYEKVKRQSQLQKLRSALAWHLMDRINFMNVPKRKPFDALAYIQALLDSGISPNTVLTNELGRGTFFGMCFNGIYPAAPALVRMMLQKGANPNERFFNGEVPLSLAATEPEVFRMLLDAGAKPDSILELRIMHVVRPDRGEPKTEQYWLKEPLIHRVASAGFPECLAMLITRGVKHDEPDPDGFTPLLRAVADGNVRTVEFLVERGGRLNVTNRFGESGIALAAKVYDVSLVRRLDPSGKINELLAEFPMQTNSPLIGTWVGETNRIGLRLNLRGDGGGEVTFDGLSPWGGVRPLGWKRNGDHFQATVAMPASTHDLNNLKHLIQGDIRFDATKDALFASWNWGNAGDMAYTLTRVKTTNPMPPRK